MSDQETENKGTEISNNTDIRLESEDAALVLRTNGEMEIYFPKQGEDDPVKGPALAIFKLALAFQNPEVGAILDEMFDQAVSAEETRQGQENLEDHDD